MKSPQLAAITIVLAGAIAGSLLYIDGCRIDSPRISNLPGAANRELTANECNELCADALLPLPGATPATTGPQLNSLLTKTYGEFSAKELFDAHRDGRMIVTEGKLFFPTAQLCGQENLRGECATLCEAQRGR
jgi:hypothetical protein